MLKVMTIAGTRPELIRLSRLITVLDATFEHILVHTGQNYDYMLNDAIFKDLGIRRPDHMLGIDTSSLGHALGDTLIRTEEVLRLEEPKALLVLGDTNSSIAALMAKRMRIPVYHMEAGNRCFDEAVPEETNRRMVDHIADFNLVYTEHARRNLLNEGIHPSRILLTGSPMKEVLDHYASQINRSTVLADLELRKQEYFVVSLHREENVDDPDRLASVLRGLVQIASVYQMPVFVSTHPRTRLRLLEQPGELKVGLILHKPLGFLDYVRLQQDAKLVLSDSGTVSEESAILGFPALTLRDSIERPEALDSGSIVTVGVDSNEILEATAISLNAKNAPCSASTPDEYRVSDFSHRVVNFVRSTHHRKSVTPGALSARR